MKAIRNSSPAKKEITPSEVVLLGKRNDLSQGISPVEMKGLNICFAPFISCHTSALLLGGEKDGSSV
jgi:hypothetical protein